MNRFLCMGHCGRTRKTIPSPSPPASIRWSGRLRVSSTGSTGWTAVIRLPTTSPCGRLARTVGKSIECSSTCYLIRHGRDVIMWDTGVPEATVNDPKGWSTLPSLIVYHAERTLTSQLAEIGLAPADVTYVILSHSHGDHIGNVKLFPDAEVILQKAEYDWINSGPQADPKLNTLTALARDLLGHPKKLRLINGDLDLYGDGSVDLISTTRTYARQSVADVCLAKSGYIILSGDVVHSKGNFERRTVPALNTDRAQSLASMQRVRSIMQTRRAQIVHQSRQGANGPAETDPGVLRLSRTLGVLAGSGSGEHIRIGIQTGSAACHDEQDIRPRCDAFGMEDPQSSPQMPFRCRPGREAALPSVP